MEASPNQVPNRRGQLTPLGRAPIQRRCFSAPQPGWRILREANLSTECARAQAAARVPCAHGDRGRAQGVGAAPRQRAQTPLGLNAAIPIGRLKRRAEFLRVASAGTRCARPGLVLQAAPGRAVGGPTRVGFTVTKKIGDAVTRNRVRRRLRAAAAQVLPRRAAPGTDYVLVGRAATLNRRYSDLVGDLEAALKRLGARQGKAHK